jgi:hypothetical protein
MSAELGDPGGDAMLADLQEEPGSASPSPTSSTGLSSSLGAADAEHQPWFPRISAFFGVSRMVEYTFVL